MIFRTPIRPAMRRPMRHLRGYPAGLLCDLDLSTGIPLNTVTGLPFLTARATTKWVQGSDGIYTQVPAKVLGIDWTNGIPELLIEPQSQNVLEYSQDFSSGWSTVRSSIHATPIVAPDGSTTGSGMVATAVEGTHYLISDLYAANEGDTWTASVFVKAARQSWVQLNIWQYDATDTYRATSAFDYFELNSSWQRVSISGSISDTTPDTTKIRLIIYAAEADGDNSFTGDGTDPEIYIWGAQLEKQPAATSPIPTAGTAVTRNADAPYTALTAAMLASLSGRGQVTVQCRFGYSSADAGSSVIALLSSGASYYSILYGRYHMFQSYDGTNNAPSPYEDWDANTLYVGASKWEGSSFYAGRDDAYGTETTFDGSFAQDGNLYFGKGSVGPIRIPNHGIQWWDSPRPGTPQESLLEW